MPRLAANISMMFNEHPLPDRFEAAARAGFRGVECLWPYELPVDLLKAKLEEHDLAFALINTAISRTADFHAGLAASVDRTDEFRQLIDQALAYASALHVPTIHAMAGDFDVDTESMRTIISNLTWAGKKAAELGIALVIEPINRRDRPNWFLKSTGQALDIVREVNLASVKILFDVYHIQILEGDLTRRLESLIDWVGHVQIAGVPRRNEPDAGEVNIHAVFRALNELGYQGWVGCEYTPAGNTRAGLGWAERYGVVARTPATRFPDGQSSQVAQPC